MRHAPLLLIGTFALVASWAIADENRIYVIQFYMRFDKNSDGRLERHEWRSSRSRDAVERAIQEAGLDPDESISLETLIESRFKSSSRSQGDDQNRGYRSKIGHQRLDEDVPDWFRQRDQDRDGQVAMAEFAKDWTDELVADFLQLDANRDGLITPQEVTDDGEASERRSLLSARSSRLRYESRNSTSGNIAGRTGSASAGVQVNSAESGDDAPIDIPASYLNYAKSICKKYDANGDGYLTKDEWSGMSRDPSAADANRDHKIDYIEYARWISKR